MAGSFSTHDLFEYMFIYLFVSLVDITQGVPRIKEILNASKKISTPLIQAPLWNDPMERKPKRKDLVLETYPNGEERTNKLLAMSKLSANGYYDELQRAIHPNVISRMIYLPLKFNLRQVLYSPVK